MEHLTLVIPAKNEKESLPTVLKELEKYNLKKIIVLEKEDSETIKSISKFECELIFQKNKGYGAALIEGINNVKSKFFCIFNADGSFNPIELSSMLIKLENENADFIFASRYEKNCKSDDDTIVTLIGNYFFSYVGKIFFKLNISDILYTFVIGKTKETKQLNLKQKDFTFCVELPIKAKRSGLEISSINSFERKRIAGTKKVNAFRDGLKILLYLIKLFFKTK